MGRYLHRRAIAGVVPDLVVWKRSKDMGNIVNSDHRGHIDVATAPVTDLHPELAKLIEVKKLDDQKTAIAQSENKKENDLNFQFRRNGQAVKILDHWLKQLYFP